MKVIEFIGTIVKFVENDNEKFESVMKILKDFTEGKINIEDLIRSLIDVAGTGFRLDDPRELIEEAKRCDQDYVKNKILEILNPK